jgi:hypothetical protein
MNNKIYRVFTLAVVLAMLVPATSCKDDYEALPVEQYTIDYIFSKTDSLGTYAREYLNTVYSQMLNGHNRVGSDYLDAATDDAVSSSLTVVDVQRLATGTYNAASPVSSENLWAAFYAGIRSSSTFIDNIDAVPMKEMIAPGISLGKAWKAEARFIRAWHYFELVKRYGGVPLVGDEVRNLGENVELPRNTFEECINYIVSECEAAEDSLSSYPIANPQQDAHIVTREAAQALKIRALLYAASPLYNGGNIDGFNPLTGYSGYDVNRWRKAAAAARQFMDNNVYFSLAPNFSDAFITKGSHEVIFFRSDGDNTNVEVRNGPVGFSGASQGAGRTSPSQNLVDAFPMIDGRPISEGAYDPLHPYDNRDPRLDSTVLHNESRWFKTPLETFERGKSKPGGNLQQTKTSYYLRKFMGKFENQAAYSNTPHDWIVFRYAEILLNYAEAVNESDGPTTEVYNMLTMIRDRAGIQPGVDNLYGIPAGLTKEQMRTIIHTERRIEMAFEEQRYWDLRRWKEAQDVMSQPVEGMVIIKSGSTNNYNAIDVLQPKFDQRQYFYPIPFDEVMKNSNMVQNPGW